MKIEEVKKKVKLSVHWLPRPASKYHGSYPLGFENLIVDKLGTKNIIHFFCGSSKLGYCIDINPKVKPDLVANVENLKQIHDNTFEAGLADPPYTKKFARDLYNCEYPQWSKWVNELVRITKPGGLIAIMHNYPQPRPKNTKYVEVISILCRIKQYTKVVSIFRKISK